MRVWLSILLLMLGIACAHSPGETTSTKSQPRTFSEDDPRYYERELYERYYDPSYEDDPAFEKYYQDEVK